MITPGLVAEIEMEPSPKDAGIIKHTLGAGRMAKRTVHLRAREGQVGIDITMAHSPRALKALIKELEECVPFMEGKE